ncbi:MAG TPA: hypothetical protein VLG71_01225, partial [Candidatus Limnocylindria bacterium]|nr:hypothetical protein [Candidatus Limnocylindria bacterium]
MKKAIGDILIANGVITAAQLQECQAISTETGQRVEQCLLDKKYSTQEALAQAYAHHAGIPYVDKITDQMADLTLLSKIPLKFLRENVVMPVMLNGQITIL